MHPQAKPSPGSGRPRWRGTLALLPALALTAGGCFDLEQPVTERVQITLAPTGEAILDVTVEIADPEKYKGNPRARRRIRNLQQALLEGWDPWVGRFEAIDLAAEEFRWRKIEGEVREVGHSALLEDPSDLGRFFGDSLVDVGYEAGEGWAELVLTPRRGHRATQQQLQRFDRELAVWTDAVADYLAAVGSLYAYLEEWPDRAPVAFGRLFEGVLSEETKAALDEPTDGEDDLIQEVEERMEGVLAVFVVPEDADASLLEISRLMADPFPARTTVILPGPALEVEGFLETGEGKLAVPAVDLWTALTAGEDRWVTPNPVHTLYRLAQDETQGQAFDLTAYAARPRWVEGFPTAVEVQRALEPRLAPPPLCRARWETPEAGAGEEAVPGE